MTTIRHLAARLIALAMLSTPAAAHENSIAGLHVLLKGNAHAYSATDRWIYSPARFAGESSTAPQNQPGGICDHGDNPAVC